MENHFRRYSKLNLVVLVFILSLSLSLSTVSGQEINRKGGLKAWLAERGIDHDQFRERVRKAIEVQKRHTPRFMEMRGVEGTATGIRADGEPVFKIFTSRAGIAGIPDRLDGFPVQVEMTGRFVAYFENPRTKLPTPVPIGVSTGHPAITAGTIGARVKDTSGNVYALSNNHVYANMNAAELGDNVLQPGTVDGGIDPDDAIGTLYDYQTIDFSGGNNTIDAAIALTSEENLRNNTPDNGNLYEQFTPSEEIADAFVWQQVKKYGRTSQFTLGEVTEISVTVNVCYEPVWIFCFKSAKFVGQIAVESIDDYPFSEPGDSGSLIVTTAGNNPVGLLFAGSETRTLANPIGPVLSRFDVTIDGEADNVDNPPTVSIVDPLDGETVGGSYNVLVSASDDHGVSMVELSIDGEDYFEIPQNPESLYYFYEWITPPGENGVEHTLRARATDNINPPSESEVVTITVDNYNDPPVASFTYTCDGLDCAFDGLNSYDPDPNDDISSYEWDFGDGSSGNGPTPEHVYAAQGNYSVMLTVTDNNEGVDKESRVIKVSENTYLHIGDLDGESKGRRFWRAKIYITVHNSDEQPVADAVVVGSFDDCPDGVDCAEFQCTTGSNGRCNVVGYQYYADHLTFTVESVTHTTLEYNPDLNHDPDGDSNPPGTSIYVPRP